MNLSLSLFTAAGIATALLTGCSSDQGQGALLPQEVGKYAQEKDARFVLMDPGAQYSVTCEGFQEGRTADGRLDISAIVRNRENRRIEVQAQCVFKDVNGFEVDQTPFTTLILTENGMETVRYTALNTQAVKYTIRIRQAR